MGPVELAQYEAARERKKRLFPRHVTNVARSGIPPEPSDNGKLTDELVKSVQWLKDELAFLRAEVRAQAKMMCLLPEDADCEFVTIKAVIDETCKFYKMTKVEIVSQRRTKHYVRARQVAMFLAREMTPHSLPNIGTHLGGRDHTTILHGCTKVGAMIRSGDTIGAEVEYIRSRLKDSCGIK